MSDGNKTENGPTTMGSTVAGPVAKRKGRSNKPRHPQKQAVQANKVWRTSPRKCKWETGDLDHDGYRVDRENTVIVDLNNRENLQKFLCVALVSLDFVHSSSRRIRHGDPDRMGDLPQVSIEERIARKYGIWTVEELEHGLNELA